MLLTCSKLRATGSPVQMDPDSVFKNQLKRLVKPSALSNQIVGVIVEFRKAVCKKLHADEIFRVGELILRRDRLPVTTLRRRGGIIICAFHRTVAIVFLALEIDLTKVRIAVLAGYDEVKPKPWLDQSLFCCLAFVFFAFCAAAAKSEESEQYETCNADQEMMASAEEESVTCWF